MVREIEPGFHGNASSTSSVYSDFVDSRSPSPLSSGQGLYVEGNSDMDTDPTSNNSRAPSIFSYNSSRDGTEMLKVENGRTFNNQSDTYYLPAGEGKSRIHVLLESTDIPIKMSRSLSVCE